MSTCGERGDRPRFAATRNLARLARFLRAAGEDVADAPDGLGRRALREWAQANGRILLTRDQRFPYWPAGVLIIRSEDLDEQLGVFYGRFPCADLLARAFSRCPICNVPLVEAPRAGTEQAALKRCPTCGRLYWLGSHTQAIEERLRSVTPRAVTPQVPAPSTDRRDMELRAFLEALGFTWRGYRRKRRSARRAVSRRMAELGLSSLASYRARVLAEPVERRLLNAQLGITVTRFFRDRFDWARLATVVIDPWVRVAASGSRESNARAGGCEFRTWSMGCAGGEEPYTLRMLWLDRLEAHLRSLDEDAGGDIHDERRPSGSLSAAAAACVADVSAADCLHVLATDAREDVIARAKLGRYPRSAQHHLPAEYAECFTRETEDGFEVGADVRRQVRFEQHDYLLDPWPAGFDLILARNGLFTYRQMEERIGALARVSAALRPGGFLFVGSHDELPAGLADFEQITPRLLRRTADRS